MDEFDKNPSKKAVLLETAFCFIYSLRLRGPEGLNP